MEGDYIRNLSQLCTSDLALVVRRQIYYVTRDLDGFWDFGIGSEGLDVGFDSFFGISCVCAAYVKMNTLVRRVVPRYEEIRYCFNVFRARVDGVDLPACPITKINANPSF